jgi:hypothetical protein
MQMLEESFAPDAEVLWVLVLLVLTGSNQMVDMETNLLATVSAASFALGVHVKPIRVWKY